MPISSISKHYWQLCHGIKHIEHATQQLSAREKQSFDDLHNSATKTTPNTVKNAIFKMNSILFHDNRIHAQFN